MASYDPDSSKSKRSNLRSRRKRRSETEMEHKKIMSESSIEYKINGIGIKSYVQMLKYLISSFEKVLNKTFNGRVADNINLHPVMVANLESVSQFFDQKKDMMLNYLITMNEKYRDLVLDDLIFWIKRIMGNYISSKPIMFHKPMVLYSYEESSKKVNTITLNKGHRFSMLNVLIVMSALFAVLRGTLNVTVFRNLVEKLSLESREYMDDQFFKEHGLQSV